MDETTQADVSTNTPLRTEGVTSTAFGWCSWHQGSAEGVRLIYAYEQGSGPGRGAFACEPCRGKHGLIPFADQP